MPKTFQHRRIFGMNLKEYLITNGALYSLFWFLPSRFSRLSSSQLDFILFARSMEKWKNSMRTQLTWIFTILMWLTGMMLILICSSIFRTVLRIVSFRKFLKTQKNTFYKNLFSIAFSWRSKIYHPKLDIAKMNK